ncbi:hypothetical protein JL721_1627 [Aureococcus anophagefferens]|nr:hypothetical protein JL721_1627 [Aureococcus anophagefferens]
MPVGSGVPEYALNPDEHGNKVRVVGAMLKKGGSRGGRRNWQKRWFVLDPSGGRLRYFEDAHLNREAGQVRLSVTSEVVAATPELRGRHAPKDEGEDPLRAAASFITNVMVASPARPPSGASSTFSRYLELRGVYDDKGRPRPLPFAVRCFNEDEFAEWQASLRFSVRSLKAQARRRAPSATLPAAAAREAPAVLEEAATPGRTTAPRDDEPVIVCEFATRELGLSLVLSRGGRRDAAGDTPRRVDDFNALLATLRDTARPLALVFRRPPAVRPSQSAASEPPTPSKRLVDDDDDFEMMEFFCLDNEATAAHLDSIGYGELLARWRSGGVDRDTKVYCGDTWQAVGDLPALVAKLDGDRRTSFFEDLRVSH